MSKDEKKQPEQEGQPEQEKIIRTPRLGEKLTPEYIAQQEKLAKALLEEKYGKK